jgi:hypothetical protein
VILDYELMNPGWWWTIIFLILEKVRIDFSFSVHLNQPRDLSCANIIEMTAESDPRFIPNISRWIFFVTLDYELMNPILIRWEHISSAGSASFKVLISNRHSEKLCCQYLEKGRKTESEKSISCMK